MYRAEQQANAAHVLPVEALLGSIRGTFKFPLMLEYRSISRAVEIDT